jgi:hypothetical protein
MTIVANSRKLALVAILDKLPGNYPKLTALVSRLLMMTDKLMIGPQNLWMSSLGNFTPPGLNECALVIPLVESTTIYLKMCTLDNVVLDQKGFHGSDLELHLKPQMTLLFFLLFETLNPFLLTSIPLYLHEPSLSSTIPLSYGAL